MGRLRVGLVGARRARQGLGPFIARDLDRLGTDVRIVLGTSEGSAEAAARDIRALTPIKPRPTASAEAFFGEGLDLVCVLTPAGTHIPFIEQALAHGCSVLTEKPVFWHPDTGDWAGRARDLEDRFHAAGLVLAVNAQWPWTLPAYGELHGPPKAAPRSLAMGLAPASLGAQMIGDAVPHPLSLAQALIPSLDGARDVTFESPGDRSVRVHATLTGPSAELALEVHLMGDAQNQPREAWYAIDGKRADRCVRKDDYAMFLRHGAQVVDLPDPLFARLGTLVRDLEDPEAEATSPVDRSLSKRVAMLASIDAAFRRAGGTQSA